MMHFLILIVLLSCGFASVAQAKGKRYIVAIGINQYQDPTWNTLRFASKDAADIYQHFQNWYDGGWMVTDGGEDGQPAKPVQSADIRIALQRLQEANLSEDDTVIVYISSHGSVGRRVNPDTGVAELDKVIVTADTQSVDPTRTGFSHSELLEHFRKLKSRRKALILDSCYSGGGKSKLNARMLSLLAKQKSRFFEAPPEDPGEGSMILAASAWGEEAQEYLEGKNGLYTHFLLQGFRRGLGRGDEVTLTEAHAFATQAVKNQSQGLQNPTAVIELVGNDPILVKGEGKVKKSPKIYSFDWTAKRLKILVDGLDKGSMESGVIEIPEGLRRITIIEPEKKLILSDRTLRMNPGQEYALSSLLSFTPGSSFAIISKYGWWLDSETKTILGEEGFGLHGAEANFFNIKGLFDLSLGLTTAQAVKSTFESETMSIAQSVDYYGAYALLGKQIKINSWSDFGESKGRETFIVTKLGLSGAHLERAIDAKEFTRSHQTMQRWGLAGELGLQMLLHDSQLLIGGGMQTHLLPSLSGAKGLSVRVDLGLHIGRAF